MSITLTTTLAPSGCFCPPLHGSAPGSLGPVIPPDVNTPNDFLIYNPGVRDKYRNSYTMELQDEATAKWLVDCQKTPVIEQAHIDKYSETCIELAKDLAQEKAHLRLGPLRGAARPCLMMDVMASGSGDFTFFNYKEGSHKKNASRVMADLLPILSYSDPSEEIYRIQIVDTAVGGYGVNALAEYLRFLKQNNSQFKKQNWELDFRIIHASNQQTNVGNIERVKSHAVSNEFDVKLCRYIVPDLIVEDYEAALGLTITEDNGTHVVKQSYQEGRFLLKSDDGTRLIETEALVVTFDEIYSSRITDKMVQNQNLKQVGNVWQDYQQKG